MSETAEKLRATAAKMPDVTSLARPHFVRDPDAKPYRLPAARSAACSTPPMDPIAISGC
jgi:hypothetical protein